jgi:hypothetical protein
MKSCAVFRFALDRGVVEGPEQEVEAAALRPGPLEDALALRRAGRHPSKVKTVALGRTRSK